MGWPEARSCRTAPSSATFTWRGRGRALGRALGLRLRRALGLGLERGLGLALGRGLGLGLGLGLGGEGQGWSPRKPSPKPHLVHEVEEVR